MNLLHNYEAQMIAWFKASPVHLPISIVKWLGRNMWWLTLIGLVSAVISIFGLLQSQEMLDAARQFYIEYGIVLPEVQTINPMSKWIGILSLIGVVIFEFKAVMPLKQKKKIGWDFLVNAAVISLVGSLLSSLIDRVYLLSSLVTLIVFTVLLFYILFEIRPEFAKKAIANKATKPSKSTKK